MSNTNTGGPAFPIPLQPGQGWQGMAPCDGMTLRDYFAAKALPVVANGSHAMGQDFLHPDYYESAAVDAYRMADAMLKEREA